MIYTLYYRLFDKVCARGGSRHILPASALACVRARE